MADAGAVGDLVDDQPEMAASLEAILDVDAETEEWTFDDVPVDTGEFGKLVSMGVVEADGDGYRVADREAVLAALGKGTGTEPGTGTETGSGGGFGLPWLGGSAGGGDSDGTGDTGELSIATLGDTRYGWVGAGAVALVLSVLFVVPRWIPYRSVFRDGQVVLAGNDPYYYRHWVDRALAHSQSPIGLETLLSKPVADQTGEPLLVATLWWVSTLAGGTQEAAGLVLAVYPVVAALAAGVLVYVLGARILGDRRIGLLAAGILAILPAHAMRTSVGFADHHAFDYLWLLAVVTVLAWLASVAAESEPFGRRSRRGTLGLGTVIAGLTLSWNGSPLVLLPVAGYLAVAVPLDVSEDRSPLRANAPVLGGLVVGAVLTLGVHAVLGWQFLAVAAVPALLAAGGVGLAAGSEFLSRRGLSAERLAALEAGVPIVGVILLAVVVEGAFGRLVSGIGFLLGTGGIAETASAFGPGQLLGVELLGFVAVLAVPSLLWASRRALLGDRHWLVLTLFAWYLLVLSLFQLRFTGQLSMLVSLFAGMTVVWALARVDLTAPPAPLRATTAETDPGDTTTSGLDTDALTARSGVVALVLVVALAGPSVAFLPERVSSSAVDDPTYEAATWIAEYADDEGLTYPDTYVLSAWGEQRIYNYTVIGASENYTFAQENYSVFVSTPDPDPLYHRWRNRVGFVAMEPLPPRDNTAQQHLFNAYGSRWVAGDGTVRYEAVSHYRAVFVTENGGRKVFRLVPGARVVGRVEGGNATTVEMQTTVEIPNERFQYWTVTSVNETGHYRAVVPYPGEYEVRANNETRTVTVPESAVLNGTRVAVAG